ncbi:MAG: phosphotransferase, partial [Anaerolineae bacterium]|nr:phosphotransferase [Anaerolineae bacterium]
LKLKDEIARRYSVDATAQWSPIVNGDECLVWRIAHDTVPLIVRVSPAWRTADEVCWVHRLMTHCKQSVPEVVTPIAAGDGSTFFLFEAYPVAVFPFVAGDTLDITNGALREQAARLLARIHQATATFAIQAPHTHQPPLPQEVPDFLQDAKFDAWVASLPQQGLILLPIHGDYYRRNVLATDSHITGVIDWDEAQVTYLIAETGWAAWEFCQTPARDDLDMTKAINFLNAYLDEHPPCSPAELRHAVNFIRLRLRDEILNSLVRKGQGEPTDEAYTEAEIRAFNNLRDTPF